MEIISRSNHGFRKRPSFQKIANKPNKEINYVVNPKQAVRDSYEFSNLINGEVDVEDEIKNNITDEMFNNAVEKEIERRINLKKEKQKKTEADLRGDGIPSTLPERAAQQRVEVTEAAAAAPAPEIFSMASDDEPTDEVPMEVPETPVQIPKRLRPSSTASETRQVLNNVYKTVDTREAKKKKEREELTRANTASETRQVLNNVYKTVDTREAKKKKKREKLSQDILGEITAITAQLEEKKKKDKPSDDVSTIAQEATETKLKEIAKEGVDILSASEFFKIINKITIPAIKQQLIFQGIEFNDKMSKADLIKHVNDNKNKWTDSIESELLSSRIKEYTEQYGSLPIELVKYKKSVKSETKAGSSK